MQTISETHIKYEFFPTRPEPIISFLDNYKFSQNSNFIEFNAGNGSISKLLKEYYPYSNIIQIEIRPEEEDVLKQFGSVHIGDFLDWKIPKLDNMVFISNPAFSITTKLLDHIFDFDNNAHVIILQRLGFLSSVKRRAWFQIHPISALYSLSSRPSFIESGKRDRYDYGWYVFGGDNAPRICPI